VRRECGLLKILQWAVDGVKPVNGARWTDEESADARQYGVNALTKNGILTPGERGAKARAHSMDGEIFSV
jgi:hypothetical protein